MDEQIIAWINSKRLQEAKESQTAELFESVATGYLKNADWNLHFVEQTILEGRLIVKLPDNFTTCSPKISRWQYPLESKPDLIYSGQNGMIEITFNHSLVPLQDAEVESSKSTMMREIATIQPEVRWEESGVKTVAGRNIGFCDFVIPQWDEDRYHLLFVMELQHRVLIGGIFCPATMMDIWKPLALGLMNAVKVNPSFAEPPVPSEVKDFTNYEFKSGFYGNYQNQEYRVFKLKDGCYRLLSNDPGELANGFEKQDGCYKKTVAAGEVEQVYELKTKVVFQGHQFELGQVLKNQVQLVVSNKDRDLIRRFQFEIGFGAYEKWIAKELIEDVIVAKIRSST